MELFPCNVGVSFNKLFHAIFRYYIVIGVGAHAPSYATI